MEKYTVTFKYKDNAVNITTKSVGIVPAIETAKKAFYKLTLDDLMKYEIVKVEKNSK